MYIMKSLSKLDDTSSKEQIITTWEATGYLFGLGDNMKEKVALAFEEARNWYLTNDVNAASLELIFPIIRRVLDGLNKKEVTRHFSVDMKSRIIDNFSVSELIRKLNLVLPSVIDTMKLISTVVDVEAMSCAHICDIVIQDLVNTEIRKEKSEPCA